jgi:predicted nucleic acid-binding Zn ribbon protein
VIPVQNILPRVLAEVIRKAPISEEKVAFAWRTAVGPAIAGATDVVLRDGVLRVTAKSGAWQRELERSAAMIRARLDDLLGAGVVRYIDVSVPAAPAAGPGPAAAARSVTATAAAEQAPKSPSSGSRSDSGRRRR